jgi:archaellum component FlaC
MKDLTRSLLTFVLVYGTKDRERFDKYAIALLEKYGLEEKDQRELIDFAYEFFHDLGQRFNQIDIISRGVGSGVSDLEKKLEAITEKLASIESKINTPASDTYRGEQQKQ